MEKKKLPYILLSILLLISFSFFMSTHLSLSSLNLFALLPRALPQTVTTQELKDSYNAGSIKVLIVPGHDNEYSGTEFRGTKEADVNLIVSNFLYNYLASNSKFKVSTSRDFLTGEYTKEFQDYFETQQDEIYEFIKTQSLKINTLVDHGQFENEGSNHFNTVNGDIRFRLYGINKWANDNEIDIAIHVHFNDYGGRKYNKVGKYSGFSLYVPEYQLPNSDASQEIAHHVARELSDVFAKSDLAIESDTVIPTQELIAIGSNASREKASFLIEYGYIYEPYVRDRDTRTTVLLEMAYKTYRGIVGYFDQDRVNNLPISTYLPYYFSGSLDRSDDPDADVVRLQAALSKNDFYPPQGETLQTCPISGLYGNCTARAISSFQRAYADKILSPLGLQYPTGKAGPRTLDVINKILLQSN